MTWQEFLSSPAASAAIAAMASVGTMVATRIFDQRATRAQRQSETDRMKFDAGERRLDVRLAAVVDLGKAAIKHVDRVVEYEHQHGYSPSTVHDDYQFSDLNDALVLVSILTTPELTAAAHQLCDAARAVFDGRKGCYELFKSAQERYEECSRSLLSGAGVDCR